MPYERVRHYPNPNPNPNPNPIPYAYPNPNPNLLRYLDVLAGGGIQLRLDGTTAAGALDEDGQVLTERISKRVLVRMGESIEGSSSNSGGGGGGRAASHIFNLNPDDGAWRERALSQLSGGQWRRVSLALDMAFAEAIRRRGTLRSSLLVMDEVRSNPNPNPNPDPDPNANPNANPNTNLYPNPQVLTHLDASGRSAVGDMLRRVARHPSGASAALGTTGTSEDNHAEELGLGYGTRDTVLVILQDLAATELEESFDSVDVVVKKRDVARVRID